MQVTELQEGNIYLVAEKDSNEMVEKWLSRNFDKMFVNELNDWYTDEDTCRRKELLKCLKNGLILKSIP